MVSNHIVLSTRSSIDCEVEKKNTSSMVFVCPAAKPLTLYPFLGYSHLLIMNNVLRLLLPLATAYIHHCCNHMLCTVGLPPRPALAQNVQFEPDVVTIFLLSSFHLLS